MAGRGKYLEILKRLQEDEQRARELEQQRLQEEEAERAANERANITVGRGRGLIHHSRPTHSQSDESASSISNYASNEVTTSVSQRSGSGRGQLLKLLKNIK